MKYEVLSYNQIEVLWQLCLAIGYLVWAIWSFLDKESEILVSLGKSNNYVYLGYVDLLPKSICNNLQLMLSFSHLQGQTCKSTKANRLELFYR